MHTSSGTPTREPSVVPPVLLVVVAGYVLVTMSMMPLVNCILAVIEAVLLALCLVTCQCKLTVCILVGVLVGLQELLQHILPQLENLCMVGLQWTTLKQLLHG